MGLNVSYLTYRIFRCSLIFIWFYPDTAIELEFSYSQIVIQLKSQSCVSFLLFAPLRTIAHVFKAQLEWK